MMPCDAVQWLDWHASRASGQSTGSSRVRVQQPSSELLTLSRACSANWLCARHQIALLTRILDDTVIMCDSRCHAIHLRSTPHHRMISKTPSVALCPMLVSISDHRGPARACNGGTKPLSSASSTRRRRRPARAWLSSPSPYRSTVSLETLETMLYYSLKLPPGFHRPAGRGTTTTHSTVCKQECMYAICSICSFPAYTTSAISSTRVLTHRLAICSPSELLHRGNS